MSQAAEDVFDRASRFAKLSYIGIIFPPVGVTLSLVTHYMLKGIVGSDDAEEHQLKTIRRIGHWGGIVSIWPFWLIVGGIIVGIIAAITGH